MDAIKAIETRKSVRGYTHKEVLHKDLEILVMAAQSAPKAGLFHISVLTNKEILTELDEKTLTAMKNSGNDFLIGRAGLAGYRPLYGAPVLFLISAPKDEHYGQVNSACAATNLTIAATALGLGSCYVITPTLVLAKDESLCDRIGIPQGYTAICGVLAGEAGSDNFSANHPTKADNVNYTK